MSGAWQFVPMLAAAGAARPSKVRAYRVEGGLPKLTPRSAATSVESAASSAASSAPHELERYPWLEVGRCISIGGSLFRSCPHGPCDWRRTTPPTRASSPQFHRLDEEHLRVRATGKPGSSTRCSEGDTRLLDAHVVVGGVRVVVRATVEQDDIQVGLRVPRPSLGG